MKNLNQQGNPYFKIQKETTLPKSRCGGPGLARILRARARVWSRGKRKSSKVQIQRRFKPRLYGVSGGISCKKGSENVGSMLAVLTFPHTSMSSVYVSLSLSLLSPSCSFCLSLSPVLFCPNLSVSSSLSECRCAARRQTDAEKEKGNIESKRKSLRGTKRDGKRRLGTLNYQSKQDSAFGIPGRPFKLHLPSLL